MKKFRRVQQTRVKTPETSNKAYKYWVTTPVTIGKLNAEKHDGKVYVLDTNVLVHDPEALNNFDEHEIVIPINVIEEMDGLKKAPGEVGRNARITSKKLDMFGDDIYKGAKLPNGGKLTVIMPIEKDHDFEKKLHLKNQDNGIIRLAYELPRTPEYNGKKIILVSKDTNVRVKARSLNKDVMDPKLIITAEDYETDKVTEVYTGIREIEGKFENENSVPKLSKKDEAELYENEFVYVKDGEIEKHFRYKNGKIISVEENSAFSIVPKNNEQNLALELLLDRDIKLSTLVGKAGTGKTLMAVAVALHRVIIKKEFEKMYLLRPIVSMGNEIGFLPGNEREKLLPWLRPIYDNLEVAINSFCKAVKEGKIKLEDKKTDEEIKKIENLDSNDKISYVEMAINICKQELAKLNEAEEDSSEVVHKIEVLEDKQKEIDWFNSEIKKLVAERNTEEYKKNKTKQAKSHHNARITKMKNTADKIKMQIAAEYNLYDEKKIQDRKQTTKNLKKARELGEKKLDIFARNNYNAENIIKELETSGKIVVESLSYIRGRSLPNTFIIIDEAQNLTPHEVKTIVTRAGEGTTIVMSGDPYQIDSPYLDEYSNGLSYTVESLKNNPMTASITLLKSERSALAELAADKM